jgi:hypothetical protein
MATYKTLDDYCASVSRNAFKEIQAMISNDFQNGIIDQPNYDELLEDLQNEIEEEYFDPGGRRDER